MGGDQSPKPINPAMDNQENKCKGRPPRPLYSAEPYLKSNAFFKSRPASCYPFPATSPPLSRSAGGHRVFIRRDPAISTGGPLGRQRVVVIGWGGRLLRRNRGKKKNPELLTNRRCSKVLFLFLNTDGFFAFSC